jgi:hypothetical protein
MDPQKNSEQLSEHFQSKHLSSTAEQCMNKFQDQKNAGSEESYVGRGHGTQE